jgi:hypothetical protein
MKKTLVGVVLALSVFGSQISSASDIQVAIQSIQCNQLSPSDAPINVFYNKADETIQVVQNSAATDYDVLQIVPGLSGEITLVGYNSKIGYLQMNIDSGKITMMLQGSQVSYISCVVQ